MADIRPQETLEERQALMLAGYLRWQVSTLIHARSDPLPLVRAASTVALKTFDDIGEEKGDFEDA